MKHITIKNNHTFISGAIKRLEALGAVETTTKGLPTWTLNLSKTSIEFYPIYGELYYSLCARVKDPEKVRLFDMSTVGKWNFLQDAPSPEEALQRLDSHLSSLKSLLV
jgi:hypothetical protein